MRVWLTSDTHFGHQNIIRYCDRPFGSVEEMNEALIERWNNTVDPDDTVYHLGDVALGKIANSLPLVGRLNGTKKLVLGNHDRPFMRAGKADEQDWYERYLEVFDEVTTHGFLEYNGHPFALSHFPYDGDSHDKDRYITARYADQGVTLIHGHTHTKDKITRSKKGTLQYHVGVDAHDFRPVNIETIIKEIENDSPTL